MLHRNDITYTHGPRATSHIRPVGRGQSLQLPVPLSPLSVMPCTAVPVSLFGLPATFKFMATAARWRAACVKRRAAHFGENWVGVVPRMVEGGVRGVEWRIQTTCNNFVQKFFPSRHRHRCRRHNLRFLLAHFLALLQCHSGHAPYPSPAPASCK